MTLEDGNGRYDPLADIPKLPQNVRMLVTWLVVFLVPPVVGFLIGRVRWRVWRNGLLALFMIAPALLLNAMFVTAQSSPGDFLWWQIGMATILVPSLIWAAGAFAGFSIGKPKVS